MSELVTWVHVADVADVPEGAMLGITAAGNEIAVYHLEGGDICATANVCTHEFATLTDGWLEGCEVECPLHAGRFDVRNGRGMCEPITQDLVVYQVQVKDGAILVALPGA